LLARILPAWDIAPQNVIGHSDMALGRKDDPGPHFDWARLATKGLAAASGNHAEPCDPDPALFRKIARRQGYSAQTDDETLLRAVRLRHRPDATGPLAPADFAVLGHPTPKT
jgi:N-acetylmuramoyl-L-alanine amidase